MRQEAGEIQPVSRESSNVAGLLASPMRARTVCRCWPDVGYPRFRRDPFVRGGVFDLGRASASQKDGFTWKRIEKLANDFLPTPRILHPWPSDRFAVKHPRWEPYAGNPHVRICAGGVQ